MPDRIYNFSAGPATLPYSVLQQTAKDVVNFQDSGMGIVEISHRSPWFAAVIAEAESLLRTLLAIPDNYKVLFLQGGASSQFFMVPMNLLSPGKKAAYLNTGVWSKKAIAEARLFGEVVVPYSSEAAGFKRVPTPDEYQVDPEAEYLYFVSNNTIYGTQYQEMPTAPMPLVADMSSDFLSRPVDVARFGLIFAGAQKNLGPAGVTVVIIREDLLDRAPATVPTMLRYKTHAEKGSMFNTPPCFAVYMVREVLKWLKALGGVQAMREINEGKAGLLYQAIDKTPFYRGHAEVGSRSRMNVTFNLPTAELEKKFALEAANAGMAGLKGHSSVGGCRASIYNAMPREGVEQLARFMRDFAARNAAV
ncbi:MAG: 3-phosphoserine/phosphohydroxythreonine transaminase [Desulfobulbaceae bacterium]|jgi:phosphoserine aminotransferase|nr:3-phosphoserine/phosphohydroxythreonine transaminase [Desulfobulbaceae bacterium]